jgi:hypothetical protein
MEIIKKYWPVILCVLLFFAGRLTAPKPDKELKAKFEAEREAILEVIGQKDAQIVQMAERSHEIRRQMTLDSLRFAGALEVNQMAYSALKRKYNEINLNRATVHELDSIIAALY